MRRRKTAALFLFFARVNGDGARHTRRTKCKYQKMFSRGIQILFFIFVGVGFHCDIVPVNRSLGPSLKRRTAWPCILPLALLKKCGNSMLHHYGPKLPPRSKHSYKRHKTSSEELKLFILNSFFFFVCNVFLSPRVTVQKHAFQLKIP